MSAIIIRGNPVDGFTYAGPFDSTQDAIASEESKGKCDGEWWVAPLETPANDRDPLNIYPPADDHHETSWTVQGDLREIRDLDGESMNYAVEKYLRDFYGPDISFDSEYSCFFAYAPTEAQAIVLRDTALAATRSL